MGAKNAYSFRLFLTLCYLTITFLCVTADDEMKTISDYLNKFSHINVDEILGNDRLFTAYYKCFMGTGTCSPDARDLRDVLPPMVKSACAACSEEQKKQMKKHLDYIKQNRPSEWADLLEKFDPNGQSLEKFLANIPD